MFLSALQAFFALMIVAARRDSVRLPKYCVTTLTLAALGLVVLRKLGGDIAFRAIRQWIAAPVSQILRCRLASAVHSRCCSVARYVIRYRS